MKYCKKCTMPDTRPGITFDAEGVCSACRHYEHRSQVDWNARWKEFEAMCDKYRGMNGPGGYDCAVAVSGGKDSHFQVYILKEVILYGAVAGFHFCKGNLPCKFRPVYHCYRTLADAAERIH